MRQPPPVAVTCQGSAAWRSVQVAVPALAAAAVAAWGALWAGVAAAVAVAAAAAAAAVAVAASWKPSAPRPAQLAWTGEHWSVDGERGEIELMLDLGRWLLLRFSPVQGGRRWLPVTEQAAAPSTQALRAALYAGGGAATVAGVRPPRRG